MWKRGRVQASRNPQKAQYYLRMKDELGCSEGSEYYFNFAQKRFINIKIQGKEEFSVYCRSLQN